MRSTRLCSTEAAGAQCALGVFFPVASAKLAPGASCATGVSHSGSLHPVGPLGGGQEPVDHAPGQGSLHEARPGRYECVFQHLGQPLQLFSAADGRLVESNAAAQALLGDKVRELQVRPGKRRQPGHQLTAQYT